MASTAIRHVFYRPEARELSVWFAGTRRRYKYFDVPPETYAALEAADSRGRFFNTAIRGHFVAELVEDTKRKRHVA